MTREEREQRLGNWIAHELDGSLCRVCGREVPDNESSHSYTGCHFDCFMSDAVKVASPPTRYYIEELPALSFEMNFSAAEPGEIIPFKT